MQSSPLSQETDPRRWIPPPVHGAPRPMSRRSRRCDLCRAPCSKRVLSASVLSTTHSCCGASNAAGSIECRAHQDLARHARGRKYRRHQAGARDLLGKRRGIAATVVPLPYR